MSDRDALERAGARAWPAAETEERDGWLLRATPEVPRLRNNSGLPLDPDASLGVVEGWYSVRDAPPTVQCGPLEDRGALKRRLERGGWRVEVEADVLVTDGSSGEPGLPVALLTSPGPRWLDAWARCEGRSPASCAAHAEHVFARVAGRAVFALAPDGKGTGIAVRDPEGPVGLFSLSVREDARRQGIATALVRALAEWAGAAPIYAQVERGNAAAQDLWRGLGFRRSHGYAHYRL